MEISRDGREVRATGKEDLDLLTLAFTAHPYRGARRDRDLHRAVRERLIDTYEDFNLQQRTPELSLAGDMASCAVRAIQRFCDRVAEDDSADALDRRAKQLGDRALRQLRNSA